MLFSVWSCIVLEIDFPRNYSFACLFFFFVHVWCWVNLGSTLSSQAPLSFIPPFPSCPLHTSSWYLHNMNSGTSCLCLYYYYYSVMTFYTAGRSDISAHAVLLSRLWSSWDGLAREHVDHDHRHRYQCHQLPSPFCSAKLQLRKQRDFLLIDVFLVTLPPSHICSPAQARHHTLACGSCGNMLITLQFLLLHIVHEWKREKRKDEEKEVLRWRSVYKAVCACVCVQAVPTYSLPFLWFGLVGT